MPPYTKFVFLLIEILAIVLWPFMGFHSMIFSYIFIAMTFCNSDLTILRMLKETIEERIEFVDLEDWLR